MSAAGADAAKAAVAALYARAAPAYNAVGPQHFTYFAQRLVEYVDVRPGEAVLDVATGTGEVLLAAAARCGEGGRVLGVDLTPAMLERAAAAVRDRRLGNAALRQMDAERLDLPDASFDVVLCAFGLSSFPHPDRALDGFLRVLRRGGRLGVLDATGWFFQHDPRWRWQEEVLRAFGALGVAGAAGTPAVPAASGRPARDRAAGGGAASPAAAIAGAGFAAVEEVEDACPLVFHDAGEWWRWAWSHGSRRLLEAVAPAQLDALRQRLCAGLEARREADGMIRGTLRATLVRARRP